MSSRSDPAREAFGGKPTRRKAPLGSSNGWAKCHQFPSIYHRWQKCSRGFVVEAEAHESHGLRDAQTALQAPAEEVCVTSRQEEAGAGECLGRADQGVEFAVRSDGQDAGGAVVARCSAG